MKRDLISTPYTFPDEDPQARRKHDPDKRLLIPLPVTSHDYFEIEADYIAGDGPERIPILAVTGSDGAHDTGLFNISVVKKLDRRSLVLDTGPDPNRPGKRRLIQVGSGVKPNGSLHLKVAVNLFVPTPWISVTADDVTRSTDLLTIPSDPFAYHLLIGMPREYGLPSGTPVTERHDWGPWYGATVERLTLEVADQEEDQEPDEAPVPPDPDEAIYTVNEMLEQIRHKVYRRLGQLDAQWGAAEKEKLRMIRNDFDKLAALAKHWEV